MIYNYIIELIIEYIIFIGIVISCSTGIAIIYTTNPTDIALIYPINSTELQIFIYLVL